MLAKVGSLRSSSIAENWHQAKRPSTYAHDEFSENAMASIAIYEKDMCMLSSNSESEVVHVLTDDMLWMQTLKLQPNFSTQVPTCSGQVCGTWHKVLVGRACSLSADRLVIA
jgi:hypothetical protein